MAFSLNKVQLIGNLGKDPEIRNMNSGSKVANFSIATSETWKDKQSGEKKEKTQWHNIVVWNEGLISVVERYLKKGMTVYIEGALETRKWQDNNNVDRYSTEIVLKAFNGTMGMLSRGDEGGNSGGGGGSYGRSEDRGGGRSGGNSGGGGQRSGGGGGQPSNSYGSDMDDDIPFSMEWR